MARLEWVDEVANSGKVIADRVKEKKTKTKTI